MDPGFRLLGRRRLCRGRFFAVERSYHLGPGGVWTARDVVHHPGSAVAVPWDGTRAYFLIQFRPAIGARLLELPAGKLDVAGETPCQTARRECAEELGLRPGRLTLLHRCYTSPGFSDELSWVYLAEDLEPVAPSPEGVEEAAARLVTLTPEEMADALGQGRVDDAKTLLGIYALLRRLGR